MQVYGTVRIKGKGRETWRRYSRVVMVGPLVKVRPESGNINKVLEKMAERTHLGKSLRTVMNDYVGEKSSGNTSSGIGHAANLMMSAYNASFAYAGRSSHSS